MTDERSVQPPHVAVALALSFRILNVPAVFAVNAYRHARGPRGNHRLECREIASVDDRRVELLTDPIEARVIADEMARPFRKRDATHVVALEPLRELGRNIGQRDDRVPP